MKLKVAIATLPVLRLYDMLKLVVVSVDASSVGIGAELLQEGQPVAYAFTSLTPDQRRYFQIEKISWRSSLGLCAFGSTCLDSQKWWKQITSP